MKNRFYKLKSQFHKEAILKIATGAIAFGSLSLGVVLLVLRLNYINLSPFVYAAIGAGATLLAAGALCLPLYKSEKRIARRLDEEFGLDESVQTMLEYKNESGEIVSLQRKETEKRLAKIPIGFDLKHCWQYIVALVLAFGVFVTAIFVPVAKKQTEAPPPPSTEQAFALTEYHRLAIANLISEVKASSADESEKTQIVADLEKLLVDLEPIKKQAKMKELVVATMLSADGKADVVNTCDDLYKTLSVSESPSVDAFATIVGTTDIQLLDENLTAFRKQFQNEENKAETVEALLDEFAGTATAALTLVSTTVSAQDPLYLAAKGAVDSVNAVTGETYESLHTALETATLGAKGGLELALAQQNENRLLSDTVIDSLQLIFELSDSDLPDFNNDWLLSNGGGSGVGDDDEESGNDGGYSSDQKAYGSDDEIFDPDTGTYKQYGELIVEYQGYINDIAANLSEELKAYYIKYFDELRNSQEE